MKKQFFKLCIALCICACKNDDNGADTAMQTSPTFMFTHDWDGTPVSSDNFNDFLFTTANGESVSITRLRYLISDITFTTNTGELIETGLYNLVDVTNDNTTYVMSSTIPTGNYLNVSFTFGFNNDANEQNYIDLNSASFNVPDMLGGGYHYMQLDGKFINSDTEEQGYNYHAIRAVDNSGSTLSFPQDTFFTVDLGPVTIDNTTTIKISANIAEWFKNPNTWDLNIYNQMLMPNATAQILMYENGQSVFGLDAIISE